MAAKDVIRISTISKKDLDTFKTNDRETYDDVVKGLINKARKLKEIENE